VTAEDTQLIQTCAEHSTVLIKPPSPSIAIHSEVPGFSVKSCPGSTGFAFTISVHREIEIADEGELLRFVHEIRSDLGRRSTVSREDREGYARSRIAARDQEWISAVKRYRDQHGSWVGKLPLPEDTV
jgi:hypothetical protein